MLCALSLASVHVAPTSRLPLSRVIARSTIVMGPIEPPDDSWVTTPSGLKYLDVKDGEGEAVSAGAIVSVGYTGWTMDGNKFDSGTAFTFPVGSGRVIPGWDEGISSMRVGGTRKLFLPPELAYGESGAGTR